MDDCCMFSWLDLDSTKSPPVELFIVIMKGSVSY